MGENKAYRRPFRVTIQKQLLVLHNQVISINIVGRAFLFIGELAVGHFALFVNREVTGMGVMGRNRIQIPNIILVSDFSLHGTENIAVLFLKYIGINTIGRMSRLVVLLVLCNLVNEKQRQNFDALMEKLALPL